MIIPSAALAENKAYYSNSIGALMANFMFQNDHAEKLDLSGWKWVPGEVIASPI